MGKKSKPKPKPKRQQRAKRTGPAAVDPTTNWPSWRWTRRYLPSPLPEGWHVTARDAPATLVEIEGGITLDLSAMPNVDGADRLVAFLRRHDGARVTNVDARAILAHFPRLRFEPDGAAGIGSTVFSAVLEADLTGQPAPVLEDGLPEEDLRDFLLTGAYANASKGKGSLDDSVVLFSPAERHMLSTSGDWIRAGEATIPYELRPAIVATLAAAPKRDALHVFVVRDGRLTYGRLSRAVLEREVPPPPIVDVRNHLPLEPRRGWSKPWPIEGLAGAFRVAIPDGDLLLQIGEEWEDAYTDEPRRYDTLEVGISRAFEPAPASDAMVEEALAQLRNCAPFREITEDRPRRALGRRIFSARVDAFPKGTPWPELLPAPPMLGPPGGWVPVRSLKEMPLEMRIEGTEILVEWRAPPGADRLEACAGRAGVKAEWMIRTESGRRATDEEVRTVFAMLEAVDAEEDPREDEAGRGGRRWRSAAGWLKRWRGRAN